MYEDAVKELGQPTIGRPVLLIEPGRILINDATHGPHTPENPDDGETSQFALDLENALRALGIETQTSRLD